MTVRWYRLVLAAAAVVMALAGGLSLLFSHSAHVGAVSTQYTIEVNEQGFNPKLCQLSRFDTYRWKNIGAIPIRVIRPDAGVGSPPLFDSGYLAPGEVSSPVTKDSGGGLTYFNADHMNITMTVTSPSNSEAGPSNCSPLPPTPTPTPTRTPGPRPTPTPTVPPLPANCRATALGATAGNEGCAVAPAVAKDDDQGR
jgi:hypothetical protein